MTWWLAVGCSGGGPHTQVEGTDPTRPTEPTVPLDLCGEDACVVAGALEADLTLTADRRWVIRDHVFVEDGVTLTVEPGTTVVGAADRLSALVVRQGGRLVAEGTPEQPIVFTSERASGARRPSDWGGIVMLGRAPINCVRDQPEQVCIGFGLGAVGPHGGDDPSDDSGVLRYVRIEFAGGMPSGDNFYAGLDLRGVGAGTQVDHVQVHRAAGDGLGIVGGTVDLRHVVVTEAGDDLLDWSDGWTGRAQFVVLQADHQFGDQGIEGDNNGENGEVGNALLPRSAPTLANITVIGSPANPSSDIGLLLREGTAATIRNSQLVGFDEEGAACLDVDDDATFEQVLGGGIVLESVLLDCLTIVRQEADEVLTPAEVEAWLLDLDDANAIGAGLSDLDPGSNSANPSEPSFFTERRAGTVTGDAFFLPSDLVGAVHAGDDWTAPWTAYPRD